VTTAELAALLRETSPEAIRERIGSRRRELLARYPDKPWRANFPDVDWEFQDTLDAERGIKAMMLAPTIEVCQALIRDEAVPANRLRREGARRYGLRRRSAA
jgi:hypothetical protein